MKIRGTKIPLSWVRLLTNKDETIKMKLSTKMKRGWSRGVGVTDMFLFRRGCTFLVRPNLKKMVLCCINHGIKVLNGLFCEMNRMLLFVYSIGDVATD